MHSVHDPLLAMLVGLSLFSIVGIWVWVQSKSTSYSLVTEEFGLSPYQIRKQNRRGRK